MVKSVAIAACGTVAVSGSSDKTVRCWDLETGACLQTYEGHGGMVSSVAIAAVALPDERRRELVAEAEAKAEREDRGGAGTGVGQVGWGSGGMGY